MQREQLKDAIPTIRLLQQSSLKESTFHEYKGADALVNILTRFLDYHEPILAWGVPKTAYFFLKNKIEHFHAERLKRKVLMMHIYNSTAYERIKVLKKLPYTKVRILPELYDSEVATNVCADEVVFVLFKAPVTIFLIKNKEMADAYKRYFELLWKNAKKV